MRKLFQILLILYFSYAFSVPALYEKVHHIYQPDGSVLVAHLVGDEFFHFFVDEKGFPIVKRDDGWWVYGVFENGKIVPTERIVGRDAPIHPGKVPKVSVSYTKSLPSSGTLNLIVILVNFSDTTVTFSREDFQELLFGDDPIQATGPGSMKDYFFEVSNGKVILTGYVTDWVTVSNPHDYYAPIYMVPDLVREAVELVDPYVDFSKYDNDGDGYVDNVLIIHQGRGQEESGDQTDIWSHSGYVSPILTDDGVYVKKYTIQPEKFEDHISQIGVICHELGHAFGLPDLYDIDYSSIGIGDWGLMSSGCWNKTVNYGDTPAHPTGWSKKELNWVDVDEVLAGLNELSPVEIDAKVLRYPKEGGEYFLLEYRKLVGFDSALPGEGLIIYHVDEVNGVQSNDSHRLVDVEEADGIEDKTTQPGDPFPQPYNNSFGPDTNPSSLFYSDEESGLDITDIHFENGKIVFFQQAEIEAQVTLSNVETAKSQPFVVEVTFDTTAFLSGTLVIDFPSTILSVSNGTFEEGKVLFEIYGTSFSGSFVGIVDEDLTLSATFSEITSLVIEGGNISVLSPYRCDFDLDGDVDLDDLEILKSYWYEDYVPCDVVYDGKVDFEDLMEFVIDYRKGKR